MSAYKEIVTKTIVGKGKKTFERNYNLTTEEKPSTDPPRLSIAASKLKRVRVLGS